MISFSLCGDITKVLGSDLNIWQVTVANDSTGYYFCHTVWWTVKGHAMIWINDAKTFTGLYSLDFSFKNILKKTYGWNHQWAGQLSQKMV